VLRLLGPERVEDELLRIDPAEILLPEGEVPESWANREGRLVPGLDAAIHYLPAFDWNPNEAAKDLCEFFRVRSLEGFGLELEGMPAAIGSAGALIRYVKETQRTNVSHIRRLEVFQRGNRMALDRATRQSLELVRTQREGDRAGSLLATLDRTLTPMGARLLRERILVPYIDRGTIERTQQGVAEIVEHSGLRARLREELSRIQDLERLSSRLTTGRANARDVISLCTSLEHIPELIAGLTETQSVVLTELGRNTDPLADLAQRIRARLVQDPPTALKEGGLIRTGFDPELDELRSIGKEGKQWMARFEAGEAERGDEAEEGDEQHAPGGVEAEGHRDQQREAAVDAGAQPDPEHLGADQLLDVDRRGENRVVGVLKAVLDEGAEHGRQRAREDHRGGDHPGADELDVGDAVDVVDERRPEAESEGEQVDHRLDDAGEGAALPEGAEVGHLAAHHAADRSRLQAPHSSSSPVSRTKTSSNEAGLRTASGGSSPLAERSDPMIAIAGPAGRTVSPPASALLRTSASRSGGP